jgi:hypothetical protein
MKPKSSHLTAVAHRPSIANRQTRRGKCHMIRNSTLLFLATMTFTEAKILDFELSPAGTEDAVGLSPANEVPAVVTSTGSGNQISGGITFDTDTSTLSIAIGYGSAAGFTNLSGAATGAHIHGPAAAGAEATVLFDLATLHFPAATPTTGGLIFGSIIYTPTQAADLLNGLNYVNIHTSANTDGEIRGQLTLLNSVPEVVCPEDATVECGVATTYSATISDFDGDAITAVWSLNGVEVETDNIAATGSPSEVVVSYRSKLPDGVNVLTLTVADSAGNIEICDTIITVEDTIAPVIKSIEANPKVLWPPNHKMVPVRVRAEVTDNCGRPSWKIVSVKSNQPLNGRKDGDTDVDFRIIDDHTVLLRAERSGRDKDGRVYTITIQAKDDAGNKSELKSVKVKVPHDRS